MADPTCQGAVRRYDPNGYVRHFIAGAAFSAAVPGVAALLEAIGVLDRIPIPVVAAVGVLTATGVGIGKEIYDARTGRGVVDWRDTAWTVAGGAAVAALLLLLR